MQRKLVTLALPTGAFFRLTSNCCRALADWWILLAENLSRVTLPRIFLIVSRFSPNKIASTRVVRSAASNTMKTSLRRILLLVLLLVSSSEAHKQLIVSPTTGTIVGVPRGGGWLIPAGWNPFGYKITSLGEEYLSYDGSADSDIGRFLASLKERKRTDTLKGQWMEVVRVAKTGQAMRIYRKLQELIQFCLKTGLID